MEAVRKRPKRLKVSVAFVEVVGPRVETGSVVVDLPDFDLSVADIEDASAEVDDPADGGGEGELLGEGTERGEEGREEMATGSFTA